MTDGAAADVRLGELIHEDGAHDAALNVAFFEGVLQGDGVDDGGEHAHGVGADPIHFAGLAFDAAKDVASANDDAQFDAELVNFCQFAGNFRDFFSVEAESARTCQRFT